VSPSAREPAVRLLLGPEEGDKIAFIDKVKESLLSKYGEQPEITRFYAGETPMAEVVRCLRNQTLFARHRLIIVLNIGEVQRAEEAGTMAEYVASPADDATLLLVSPGFAGDVHKKILTGIPKDNQKIFWEMFDDKKQGWIASFFRQRKISIAPEAVDYILDMVENNTRDMRTECERLAQFFGPDADINLESVEHYIYHSKEENVFTLFDKICERELGSSVEVVDKILLAREAEATQIAGGLLMQFRRLGALKAMLAEGYQASEAFTKLRIFSKKNQKTYLEGAEKFAAAEIATIIQLLASFNERFRSVKTDLHELLLHLLVYYIVQKAGQGAWQQSL
jgi:DNA polymerase III subunit delta